MLCRGHPFGRIFGELGANLAEGMIGTARQSEHIQKTWGQLCANLAEGMVGVAHFWDRLGATLGG